jgi:cell wall-associated NlpC family hydrolase
MRKIKYISLALTVVPILFVGCVQEKISIVIPSTVKGNHTKTVASNKIENSVNAEDSSNQIISKSELDKLVALVQEKLAEESTQQAKPSQEIESPQIFTVSSFSTTPIDEILFNTILSEETLTEDIISDSSILADDDTYNELDELTQLVANGLNTEIKGIDGVYSTPIVINEKNVHKKFMIEVEEIKTEKIKKEEVKKKIKKEEVKKKIKKITKESEIISTAIAFLDTEYIWAANGPTAFDCSGFTKYVFKEHGVNIPRYSGNQARVGKHIAYKDLHVGDLVFFDTEKKYKKKVNHVGIYMGDNKFIHASSAKKKVVITSFEKKHFYKKRFLWGQRVIKDDSLFASL